MYLFFDTETTGLSRNKDHIVQLAWVLADSEGNIYAEECHIIRPDGYAIPNAAANIHGITTTKACQIGQPLALVLKKFSDAAERATSIVAHNLSFDLGILEHDYKIADLPFPMDGKIRVCTMKLSTVWCRLPKLNGSTGFKWPSLVELHFRLFGKSFNGAHDALEDSRACLRSYFELVKLGVIVPPDNVKIENQNGNKKSYEDNCIKNKLANPKTRKDLFSLEEFFGSSKTFNQITPPDTSNNEEISTEDFFRSFESLDLKIIVQEWENLVTTWRNDANSDEYPRSLSSEVDELEDWDIYSVSLEDFSRKCAVIDGVNLDKIIAKRLTTWAEGLDSNRLYRLFEWIHYIFGVKQSSQLVAKEILRRAKRPDEMLLGGIACYTSGLLENAMQVFQLYLPACGKESVPNRYYSKNVTLINSLAVMTDLLIKELERDDRQPPKYFVNLVTIFIEPYWESARQDPGSVFGMVLSTMIRFIQHHEHIDYSAYTRQLQAFINPLPGDAYAIMIEAETLEDARLKLEDARLKLEDARLKLEDARLKAEADVRKENWSFVGKTQSLLNETTGEKYPPDSYGRYDLSGVRGYRIYLEPAIWVNAKDVVYKRD